MSLEDPVRVAEPSVEPVSVADVKNMQRVDHSEDDQDIDLLISSARRKCEDFLGRSLVTQTWQVTLDCWPLSKLVKLPMPKLQSVSSIIYLDTNGTMQTLDSSNYQVVTTGNIGRIKFIGTYPDLQDERIDRVIIEFISGFGDGATNIPEDIRAAIKLMVAFLYESDAEDMPIPRSIGYLLESHKATFL
jgi:uncharacterized phiE125 gp8 family phage protein